MAKGKFQKFGSAAMTPIAVLPAAALLLALGNVIPISAVAQPLEAAGQLIINNIGLIFAVGLAIGLADDASIAGFTAAISYVIISGVASMGGSGAGMDMGILAGIFAALTAGLLYNRFHKVKFHPVLSFFAGRRFVPIIASVASVIIGALLGLIWPYLQAAIQTAGEWVFAAGGLGVVVYGALERLLLPMGLHHVLNAFVLAVMGEFITGSGEVVRGEVFRFLAGDSSAGFFLGGAYPIKLFALPAACLAMYRTALPGNRNKVKGLLVAAAATSILTGITEPVEFAFLFTAPLLYAVHILLTGAAFGITYLLGFRHGFGSSAGVLEYVMNLHLADRAWLLIPLGLGFGLLYYLIFHLLITRLNLPTPGRLEDEHSATLKADQATALAIIDALGGRANLAKVNSCLTRLRVVVTNGDLVDRDRLIILGASGVVGKGTAIQVVVGTIADELKQLVKENI